MGGAKIPKMNLIRAAIFDHNHSYLQDLTVRPDLRWDYPHSINAVMVNNEVFIADEAGNSEAEAGK